MQDCLVQGAAHGFRILQFNAVVASNVHVRHLYVRLGFVQLGMIPKGFRMKDGGYDYIPITMHWSEGFSYRGGGCTAVHLRNQTE